MDKSAVVDVVERFRIALRERGIRAQKLILFGSQAAGSAHEASDIDLVVISQDFAGMDYWERINHLSAAIYKVFEPIEAVPMTQAEWDSGKSMIVDFARDGKTLYSEAS